MQYTGNTAQILDFTAYKQSREEAPEHSNVVAPFYFWYPVWVFVPQFASSDTVTGAYGASASVAEI